MRVTFVNAISYSVLFFSYPPFTNAPLLLSVFAQYLACGRANGNDRKEISRLQYYSTRPFCPTINLDAGRCRFSLAFPLIVVLPYAFHRKVNEKIKEKKNEIQQLLVAAVGIWSLLYSTPWVERRLCLGRLARMNVATSLVQDVLLLLSMRSGC